MIYYAVLILVLFTGATRSTLLTGGYEGIIYGSINNGSYNDWSDWSMYNESCGGGIKSRNRICEIQPNTVQFIIEVDIEIENWNSDTCPKIYKELKGKCDKNNGSWNGWSVWSMCSESCGGGIKSRHRTCEIQPNIVDIQKENCNNHACPIFPASYSTNEYAMCFFLPPINGSWGQWSQSTCRAGKEGIHVRSRLCNDPSPEHCGNLCGTDKLRLLYCSASYYISNEKKSWHDAEEECTRRGGHLASIHSKEEQDFIYSKIKKLRLPKTWIGMNDIDNEGNFIWNNGIKVNYANWGVGEPNNDSNMNEDCVEIRTDRNDWNDLSCKEKRAFVCKH